MDILINLSVLEKKFLHVTDSPHFSLLMWRNLSCGEMFPHDRFLHMRNEKCQANLLCGGISPHDISLLQIMLFCCKICFVAIYAVLLRNLFCCDLRAFVWRKVELKIVLVEKKRQISGMPTTINVEDYKIIQVARDKAALGGDHFKKR